MIQVHFFHSTQLNSPLVHGIPLFAQILEITAPVFCIFILVAVKISLQNNKSFSPQVIEAEFPGNNQTIIPFSFNDYVTAIQAKRVCFKNPDTNEWAVSGIDLRGYGWQVPFVKCDSRACKKEGDNAALYYCEYQILALAPMNSTSSVGKVRAESFRDFTLNKYPALVNNIPFSYNFIRIFESNQEIDDYVTSSDYGGLSKPKLGLAVIFSDGASIKEYKYDLRVNSTNFNAPEVEGRPGTATTPNPAKLFDNLANVDSTCTPIDGTAEFGPNMNSCTSQYIYNGALVIQRLVNDWIIEDSGARAKNYTVAEHGVQFVPFPTKQFTKNGFYSTISGSCPFHFIAFDGNVVLWYCFTHFRFSLTSRVCSSPCRHWPSLPCRLYRPLNYF